MTSEKLCIVQLLDASGIESGEVIAIFAPAGHQFPGPN
jgi:uncharacterized protein YoaH (UPF0181 family)